MIFVESKNLEKENIFVLISPWKSSHFSYYFIKKAIPQEFGLLHYSYAKNILNSSPEETRMNFLRFIEKIIQDLNDLEKITPRNYFLYGQSLGGLFCMIVADKIRVKKVMLIAPGSNLAESFWRGNRTGTLKKEMERNGMSLDELKKYWQEISPDNYFKDKSLLAEFFIILSSRDKTIPIDNGKKLTEILENQNVKLVTLETRLKHMSVCVRESLFTNNFRKFFFESK